MQRDMDGVGRVALNFDAVNRQQVVVFSEDGNQQMTPSSFHNISHHRAKSKSEKLLNTLNPAQHHPVLDGPMLSASPIHFQSTMQHQQTRRLGLPLTPPTHHLHDAELGDSPPT